MTRTVKFDGRPIWAEVSLGALTHNFRAIRNHVNPEGRRSQRRKILAVIKSNAYGHGIVPVARALSKARADWFGVTCSAEGAELRDSGIREPVLILTGFWAGEQLRIDESSNSGDHERPTSCACWPEPPRSSASRASRCTDLFESQLRRSQSSEHSRR